MINNDIISKRKRIRRNKYMQIEVGDFVIASSCKNGDVQSNWGIGTVTNIYHNQYGTFYGL